MPYKEWLDRYPWNFPETTCYYGEKKIKQMVKMSKNPIVEDRKIFLICVLASQVQAVGDWAVS